MTDEHLVLLCEFVNTDAALERLTYLQQTAQCAGDIWEYSRAADLARQRYLGLLDRAEAAGGERFLWDELDKHIIERDSHEND